MSAAAGSARADRADAEYVWVLDPIDGTKSFMSGMPAWGTLIALTRFGAYATALNVGTQYLRRVPEGWTPEQAEVFAAT